jgi:hypothetical protein
MTWTGSIGGFTPVTPIAPRNTGNSTAIIDEFNQMVKELNGDLDNPASLEGRFRFKTPEQKQRFMELTAYIAANNLGGEASQRFGTILHDRHNGRKDEKISLFAAVELIRRQNKFDDKMGRPIVNGRFTHPDNENPGSASAEADAETSLIELVMHQCASDKDKDFLSFTDSHYAKPLTPQDKQNMLVNGSWAGTQAGRMLLNAKSGGVTLNPSASSTAPSPWTSRSNQPASDSHSAVPTDIVNQLYLLSMAMNNLAMVMMTNQPR